MNQELKTAPAKFFYFWLVFLWLFLLGFFFFIPIDDITAAIPLGSSLNYSNSSAMRVSPPSKPNIEKRTITLGFQRGGIFHGYLVKIGEKIAPGQPLAELEKNTLQAELEKIRQTLAQQSAQSENKGVNPLEVRRAEVKVERAKATLEGTQKNLFYSLLDLYARVDDAIYSKTDQFINDPTSLNPRLPFVPYDPNLPNDFLFKRILMEKFLTSWKSSLAALSPDDDLIQYSSSAFNNAATVKEYLEAAAQVLTKVSPNSGNPSVTTLRNWKLDLSSARTNLTTGLKNLVLDQERFREAQSDLILLQIDLDDKRRGTGTGPKISSSEIGALESRAKLIEETLVRSTLTSSIAGTVVKETVKAGEVIVRSRPVLSILPR